MGVMSQSWESILSEEEIATFHASGYGTFLGLGARPALVVVDVTYAFTGDKDDVSLLDSITKWPNSCGPCSWPAVRNIERLLATFRSKNMPIFYTKMAPVRADRVGQCMWRSTRIAPDSDDQAPPAYGGEIVRDIAPQPRDIVIQKHAPSAFFGTGLMAALNGLAVDSIVVCGTTTSGCVRASVVDAFSYNVRAMVVDDATFDRLPTSHAMSLFDMDMKYADVVSTDDLIPTVLDFPADMYAGQIDPAAEQRSTPRSDRV